MPEANDSIRRESEEIPVFLDREIARASDDAFGHRHFSKLLKGLIESQSHRGPYSIGLLGGWGTGKSSVKQIYLSDLSDSTGKGSRSERFKVITFNAWRYGGEDIRRALLRDVFCELGGDESLLFDKFFNQIQQKEKRDRAFQEVLKEMIHEKLIVALGQYAVLALLVILATKIAALVMGMSDSQTEAFILIAFAALGASGAKYFFDPKTIVTARYADVTRIEQPHASSEQYEKLLRDQVGTFKSTHKECQRLIIFVDDLDRLSGEEMVSGLDAVRTLMDISPDKAGLEIIFVISCDEDRVAEALSRRDSKSATEMPGAIVSRSDARRYLDRIFQFRLELPTLPRQDMRAFIQEKLSDPAFKQIQQVITDAGSSEREVVGRMIHVGVQSPRNALQILNAFTQSMWIAIAREFEGKNAPTAGALTEGSVTKYPVVLGIVSVLKVDFPDFYRDLQRDPGLLNGFILLFARGEAPDRLTGSVKKGLLKYCVKASSDSVQVQADAVLDEKYWKLRQFLSGVASVELPTSLQPLLLLNQDKISRKTGDAGSRLFDPLISADFNAVLQVLDRQNDKRNLTSEEVDLLADVWEAIEQEEDAQQENAAFVIIKLIERVVPANRRDLVTLVFRSIVNSKPLRTRVGIPTLKVFLTSVAEREALEILEKISEDWIPEADFPLPSRDSTTVQTELTEAIELLIEYCLIDKLGSKERQRLADWLVDRSFVTNFGTSASTQVLPFKDLENWITKFGEPLRSLLGSHYIDAGLAAISGGALTSLGNFVEQVKPVLEGLSNGDQVEQERFWALINQFFETDENELLSLGQCLATQHLSKASASQLALLAKVTVARLTKFAESEYFDEVEENGIGLLESIYTEDPNSLVSLYELLSKVSISLSVDNSTADAAVRVAQLFSNSLALESQEFRLDWASRISNDLPAVCAGYLGKTCSELTDEEVIELTEGLDLACKSEDLTVAGAYNSFWEAVTQEGARSEAIQTHLTHLSSYLVGNVALFPKMQATWPSVRRAISKLEPAQAGTLLNSMMLAAKSLPIVFTSIMLFLSDWWPENLDAFAPFSNHSLMHKVTEFLNAYGTQPGTKVVIRSANSFLLKCKHNASEDVEEYLKAVIGVWNTSPKEVAETAIENVEHITPEMLSQLLGDIQDNDPYTNQIFEVISALASRQPAAEGLDYLDVLLDSAPLTINGTPDSIVFHWITGLPLTNSLGLITVLDSQELSDGNKWRVWEQLLSLVPAASVEWIVRLLILTANNGASLERSAELFYRARQTNASPDRRRSLCQGLIFEYPKLMSVQSKKQIALWIRDLDGSGQVTDAIKANVISGLLDFELLLEAIPSNKLLKSRLKKQKAT